VTDTQDRDGRLLGDLVARASEVDELKRTWYSHVLHTLEKLDIHIDSVVSETHKTREELQRELYQLRDELRKEIANTKTFTSAETDRLRTKIEEVVSRLESRIALLEKSEVKEQLKQEINDLKNELTSDITCKKDTLTSDITSQKDEFIKLLEPLRTKITRMETKLAMWAILFGIVGTAFTQVAVVIIKHFIK